MLLSMESTSNRMSRLGKSLITGSELLSLEELVERVDAVTGDEVAEIAGDLLRARPALGRRDRPERGALQGRGAARQPGARRAQGSMKVLLLGRHGKVGSVLGPALEEAGHELVDSSKDADAAVDFTRPDAVEENVRVCLEDGVPVVVGTTGFDQERVAALARSTSCRSSTRRTSRSARC